MQEGVTTISTDTTLQVIAATIETGLIKPDEKEPEFVVGSTAYPLSVANSEELLVGRGVPGSARWRVVGEVHGGL